MRRPAIVTGLDLGSSKISAVAARIGAVGDFEILAQVTLLSRGILRANIEEIDAATGSVSKALAKLKDKLGRRPDNIYVNVSGQTVRGQRSKGMIPLALRGREVTRADMARCVNAASTINLPLDREVIHKIVHLFSVDDQPHIKNPLGLNASRLACETYVITGGTNHMQNIAKCVSAAGYDIREFVFTGMAEGAGLLGSDEKADGAVLLDIGASVTEISSFYGGVLDEISVVLSGTGDISADPSSCRALDGIVSETASAIEGLSRRGARAAPVVLTGGVVFMDQVVELLGTRLSSPVRVGVVKGVKGDISAIDSMRMAAALGLAKYGYEAIKPQGAAHKNFFKGISAKVVDIFNNYF